MDRELVAELRERGASPIPWCTEHGYQMLSTDICVIGIALNAVSAKFAACRLEEPQAVYRIGVDDGS